LLVLENVIILMSGSELSEFLGPFNVLRIEMGGDGKLGYGKIFLDFGVE
jgi:hypothetical protein